MPVGELLLEFTSEALLDLVEAGKKRDGDEDYNGTFAMADFELWRSVSVCIRMEETSSVVPHEQRRIGVVSAQT